MKIEEITKANSLGAGEFHMYYNKYIYNFYIHSYIYIYCIIIHIYIYYLKLDGIIYI